MLLPLYEPQPAVGATDALEALRDLLIALVRVDQAGVQGLAHALAADLRLDYAALEQAPAQPIRDPIPPCFPILSHDLCRTKADFIERLELLEHRVVTALIADHFQESVIPAIVRSCLGQEGVQTVRTLRFLAESPVRSHGATAMRTKLLFSRHPHDPE